MTEAEVLSSVGITKSAAKYTGSCKTKRHPKMKLLSPCFTHNVRVHTLHLPIKCHLLSARHQRVSLFTRSNIFSKELRLPQGNLKTPKQLGEAKHTPDLTSVHTQHTNRTYRDVTLTTLSQILQYCSEDKSKLSVLRRYESVI